MSGIWMRKVGLMPLSYLDRLRNSLPKIKGYQMNSHRIRNKMELWTEHWLVTKAVDIFIFKGIKGVLCCCCGSPNDASSRKHIISIMILKNIKMSKQMRCFSLLMRWSSIARERTEFIHEVAAFSRQRCIRCMMCSVNVKYWRWVGRSDTRLTGHKPHGLPVNAYYILKMQRSYCLYAGYLCCAVCMVHQYVPSPCADFVHGYFSMISGNAS